MKHVFCTREWRAEQWAQFPFRERRFAELLAQENARVTARVQLRTRLLRYKLARR